MKIKSPPSNTLVMVSKQSITSDQLQSIKKIKQHSATTSENLPKPSPKLTNQLSPLPRHCKATTTTISTLITSRIDQPLSKTISPTKRSISLNESCKPIKLISSSSPKKQIKQTSTMTSSQLSNGKQKELETRKAIPLTVTRDSESLNVVLKAKGKEITMTSQQVANFLKIASNAKKQQTSLSNTGKSPLKTPLLIEQENTVQSCPSSESVRSHLTQQLKQKQQQQHQHQQQQHQHQQQQQQQQQQQSIISPQATPKKNYSNYLVCSFN